MSKVLKSVGKVFGIGGKKRRSEEPEEEEPTVLPMPDDPSIREKMLEAQRKARGKRGRAYTRNPGYGSGALDRPSMLG